MEKSEASPLRRTPSVGREGLGEGRTAQPTPDLPGRQGGGGILSSFLHWVSNKQPGSGSLTSPGSRHVHRHLQSQNHTNCGLNSISERNPDHAALFVPARRTHSPPLLCGQLTPSAGQARLPETPNKGEGGVQTSSRMPRAGAASSIPKRLRERTRQGWRKAGKAEGSKEGRERSKDMLGQSRANRKLLRHSGGHAVLSATLGASLSSKQTQDPSRTTSPSRPSAYIAGTRKVLNLLASETEGRKESLAALNQTTRCRCVYTHRCMCMHACTHTHTHTHIPTPLPRIKGPVEVAHSLQVLVF